MTTPSAGTDANVGQRIDPGYEGGDLIRFT